MGSALEEVENVIRYEATAHGQDVAVAMSVLVASVQAHRLNQMQVLSGACHRDVESAPPRSDRGYRLPCLTGYNRR